MELNAAREITVNDVLQSVLQGDVANIARDYFFLNPLLTINLLEQDKNKNLLKPEDYGAIYNVASQGGLGKLTKAAEILAGRYEAGSEEQKSANKLKANLIYDSLFFALDKLKDEYSGNIETNRESDDPIWNLLNLSVDKLKGLTDEPLKKIEEESPLSESWQSVEYDPGWLQYKKETEKKIQEKYKPEEIEEGELLIDEEPKEPWEKEPDWWKKSMNTPIKDNKKWKEAYRTASKQYGLPGTALTDEEWNDVTVSIYKKLGGTFKTAYPSKKREETMKRESPGRGVVDESTWKRAKKETREQYGAPGKELPKDRWWAAVSSIYKNMGGKYKKKKSAQLDPNAPTQSQGSKCPSCGQLTAGVLTPGTTCAKCGSLLEETSLMEAPMAATAQKKDKHTCSCGKNMKKVEDDHTVKPGWTKWKCDCGYSRDFRDGAPIYQAKLIKNKNSTAWLVTSNTIPVFSITQEDSCGNDKSLIKKFRSAQFGKELEKSVAEKGAYKAVQEWFPNDDNVRVYHSALKLATRGVSQFVYEDIMHCLEQNMSFEECKQYVENKYEDFELQREDYDEAANKKLARRPKGEDYASGKSNYICDKCGNVDKGCKCKNKKDAGLGEWAEAGLGYASRFLGNLLSYPKNVIVNAYSRVRENLGIGADEYTFINTLENPENLVALISPVTMGEFALAMGEELPGLVASKEKTASLLKPGYTTAQYTTTDLGVAEPGIEVKDERPEEGKVAPGKDQAPPGLVGEEVSEELLGEKPDRSNITEAISDILATIVANSDINVEDVMSELKELFSQGESISEFRGKLEEKINTTKEEQVEDTAGEEMPPAPPLDQQPSGAQPQQIAVAQLKQVKEDAHIAHLRSQKWEKYARALYDLQQKIKDDAIVMDKKANKLAQESHSLQKNLKESHKIIKRLLIERSARIRAPRAIKLASQCFEIGELGNAANAEQREKLMTSKLKDLMITSDEDFLRKEEEVDRIHQRLGQATPKLDSEDKRILAFVPNFINEDKETKTLEMIGSSKNNNKLDVIWSRPPFGSRR